MNQASTHPIVRRGLDVAQFDGRTFREIARDPNATKEAALIVALVAIANGIGSSGDGSSGLIGGIVAGLLGWIVFSAVTYFVATNVTGSPTTVASVEPLMRTLGYARAPGLLAIFGFIWLIGAIATFVAGIWVLVTSIYAVRATLNMGWLRTLTTVLIALIASTFVNLIVSLVFGNGFTLTF